MATPNVSELYLACRNGDIETVESKLKVTPLHILNQLEPNGSTCLHAASYYGHKEIVRLLLANGACRRVINQYGCTPLDEAKTQEIKELFPRSTEAAKQRFCDNPVQQLEWDFDGNNAEYYARALHMGCVKNRRVKRTIKKIEKAHVLVDDGEKSTEVVRNYFKAALTTDNPVFLLRAYTTESQFYHRLNQEMATGNRREVYKKLRKKWSGYYAGVIIKDPAFERFRFCGQTYRGMKVTPSDYAKYKPCVALTNKSFQSTSKSWEMAKEFACGPEPIPGKLPVILVFTITDARSALSIDEISDFQDEEEVLIMPATFFIIERVDESVVPYEIHLRQIEWDNEF